MKFKHVYCQDCNTDLAKYNIRYFSDINIAELTRMHHYSHIKEGHSLVTRTAETLWCPQKERKGYTKREFRFRSLWMAVGYGRNISNIVPGVNRSVRFTGVATQKGKVIEGGFQNEIEPLLDQAKEHQLYLDSLSTISALRDFSEPWECGILHCGI